METTPGAPPLPSSEQILLVDGMFCAACAASVEARLEGLPDVETARVDLASDAALIRWRAGRADPDAACARIRALGYGVRALGAPPTGASDPEPGLRLRLVVALFFGMWTMLPSIALYLDAAPTATVAGGLAWAAALFSAPVLLWAGLPFYRMGAATLRAGVPGVDALILLGVLGAVALSLASLAVGGAEVYFEVGVALVTLQLVARLVDLRVRRDGRDALARLLDLAPATAQVEGADGRTTSRPVAAIAVGEVVVAEPGARLAVDGTALGDGARLDRRWLTGETRAVHVVAGDAVHAGETVLDAALRVRVTAAGKGRRIDALARQVRTLLLDKPPWQRGVDRLARHFLAFAGLAAALGAGLALAAGMDGFGAAERALAVFVIACPCALSLAAPLAGLTAARRAADGGILLRDLRALTSAVAVDLVLVDKTGTLTEGRPDLVGLHATAQLEADDLLALAAAAEHGLRHPLGDALVEAARVRGLTIATPATAPRAIAGRGAEAQVGDLRVRIGRGEWLVESGLTLPELPATDTTRVWIAADETIVGAIDLDDALRPGAREAVDALRADGADVRLLSGDAEGPVAAIARRLGIEAVAGCSPEDKVARVEAARADGRGVAFVGDGINDGPALAAADVGIAVDDALDAARTASAVTLLRGGVDRVPAVLGLLRRTRAVIRQNLAGAVIYNLLAVPAALAGWVHPAIAAVAMAASSITVAANCLRIRLPADQASTASPAMTTRAASTTSAPANSTERARRRSNQ